MKKSLRSKMHKFIYRSIIAMLGRETEKERNCCSREFDYRQEIVNTLEIDYVRAIHVDAEPLL